MRQVSVKPLEELILIEGKVISSVIVIELVVVQPFDPVAVRV
jgi:hypothetical protein